MSNADMLMGVIALLGYVFLVCPCMVGCIASDAKYLEAVKGGVILTLFVAAVCFVIISFGVAVMYFTDSIQPDTPATQIIEWVNSL